MTAWNHTSPPRHRFILVDENGASVIKRTPMKIIAAVSVVRFKKRLELVMTTSWSDIDGAWGSMKKGEEPIAWMPCPEFPVSDPANAASLPGHSSKS